MPAIRKMSTSEQIPDSDYMSASDHNIPPLPLNYKKMPIKEHMHFSEKKRTSLTVNDTKMPDG